MLFCLCIWSKSRIHEIHCWSIVRRKSVYDLLPCCLISLRVFLYLHSSTGIDQLSGRSLCAPSGSCYSWQTSLCFMRRHESLESYPLGVGRLSRATFLTSTWMLVTKTEFTTCRWIWRTRPCSLSSSSARHATFSGLLGAHIATYATIVSWNSTITASGLEPASARETTSKC